ncbi:hypothetical protein D9Q98_009991 [Chlorella vulgaris]|uniref:Uncharacterized protein n=1 Tax=Chlorella vulgaris TaxID=3077 RepID=A0A9D4TFX4_CHLVU|nr:hypothetical protein D9Q98_009991 [Chlorella vulgaris]
MGYGEAPWEFRGRALYQLSLVKVEEARKYVPPELPLVNLFGWTLGGFYLARYSSSPAGAFDECVALAGLAWNFPTSCAWAARVYVSDRTARNHGIASVGLPSRLATFRALPLPALGDGGASSGSSATGKGKAQQQKGTQQQQQAPARAISWWDRPHSGGQGGGSGSGQAGSSVSAAAASPTAMVELCNSEWTGLAGRLASVGSQLLAGGERRRGRGLVSPVCCIEVPQLVPAWAPKINMFLPSFSGATPDCPGLLKYTLKLSANVRPVRAARVTFPEQRPEEDSGSEEVLDAVLGGRPLLCLEFSNMLMEVQPPQPWTPRGAPAAAAGSLLPAKA